MSPTRSGICPDCGFDWTTDPADLGPEIAAIGERWRQAITDAQRRYAGRRTDPVNSGHPDGTADDVLGVRHAPDVWSALEYLAHMRDIVEFFDDRIGRVLAEDRPNMAVTATFAELAEIRRYRDEEPATVLDSLEKRAFQAADRLGALRPDQWQRVGIGSGGQERTVLLLARRLAHEACHHLMDVARGSPSGP